ncbi:MAG: N-acetylmuramoyl-L-alanine amidase [Caldisericia bacterium]|nr:N-acetylmuramoyl-L-alanine amidase [Caldisericia bacterium]
MGIKLISVLLIIFLIFPFINVYSEERIEVIITPPTNIRSGPGLENEILITITERTVLKVIAEAKDKDGRVWYKVKPPQIGKEGWVASWVVEVRKIEEKPVNDIEVIITPPTNIRSGPGLENEILITITERTVLKVIAEAKDKDGRVWYKVKPPQIGKEGWVASWVVEVRKAKEEEKENAGVIKEYTNLRTGPSISYEVIKKIEPDTKVSVLGMAYNSSSEIWYFVKTGDDAGWVFSEKIRLIHIDKVVDTKSVDKKITLKEEKTLYDGPSEDMKTEDTLPKASVVTVIGVALILPDIQFFEITYKGRIYWIKEKETHGEKPEEKKEIQINNVKYRVEENAVVIEIESSKEIKEYKETLLTNPLRLVLDISNSLLLSGSFSKEIDTSGVLRVRGAQFQLNPPITRIVVDLEKNLKYDIKKTSSGLSITIFTKGIPPGYKIYLSQDLLYIFPAPFEKNNTLYIPLKSLLESLGIVYKWDKDKKEIEYRIVGKSIIIKDLKVVEKGDEKREFKQKPYFSKDEVFVPLSFIPYILEVGVYYNKETKSLYLDPYILKLDLNKESSLKATLTIFTSHEVKFTKVVKENEIILKINGLPSPNRNFKDYDVVKNISTTPRKNSSSPVTELILKNQEGYKSISIKGIKSPPGIQIVWSKEKGKGLKGKLIVLDPGHGAYTEGIYYDTGAVGPSGSYESKLVLDIANRVKELLLNEGARVVMTRMKENDRSTPHLDERVEIANSSGGDLFISFHLNASTSPDAHGTETYYFHPFSYKFAEIVQNKIVNVLNTTDRGVKRKGFEVVKDVVTMPSVLIEFLFITNPEEEKMILNPDIREKLAEAVFESIKEYFGE